MPPMMPACGWMSGCMSGTGREALLNMQAQAWGCMHGRSQTQLRALRAAQHGLQEALPASRRAP